MHTIFARNVNDAYVLGLKLAAVYGELMPSRNGPVRRLSMPVTTRYSNPTQRVLFSPQRNANPFFHLFEALWMLAGREDVGTLTQFLPSFAQFSDNGKTLHGAYGYRWRYWPFGRGSFDTLDQVTTAIDLLKKNPDDRRVVIGMWDPYRDLAVDSKDIPCNDIIKCMIVHGNLDIQVFCRSNDLIFGCYGANAVHMSMLQEYLAAMIGVPVGCYYQISADFHAYMERPYQWSTYWPITDRSELLDLYDGEGESAGDYGGFVRVVPTPLIANPKTFDAELREIMLAVAVQSFDVASLHWSKNPFFVDVAQPMYAAHRFMQQRTEPDARTAVRMLRALATRKGITNDWLTAGAEWCERVIRRRYGSQP